MNWKTLDTMPQLVQLKADSFQKPVIIFKHSTTCGISAFAKHKLESNWDFTETDFDFYYLDLLSYRPISNQVAEDFGVVHQSPQIIVIKDGQAIYNTSHHQISTDAIRKSLKLV